jgi:hypothetical protein
MSKAAKTASLDAFVKVRASNGLRLDEKTVNFVLGQTAEDCPLRKLVIDTICRDFLTYPVLGRDWLVSCLEDAPFEQTLQLLITIKHFAVIKSSLNEDPCKEMARERRNITSVLEYQTGYLKVEQQASV